MRIRRLPIQRIGVVVAVLMLVSGIPVHAQISTAKGAAPSKLHAGAEPIERSITAGDAVVYTIKLKSGQYCVVKLRQSAIDLVATLTGPDGVRIAVVDTPHWTTGEEVVEAVAEKSGTYSLTIRPKEADAPKGTYHIRLDPVRRATAGDRKHIAALRVFEQAEQLRGEGTAESLAEALKRYDDALSMFRSNQDRRGEAAVLLRTASVLATMGYLKRAPVKYREALEHYRAIGDRAREAEALSGEGSAHDEAVRLSRLSGDAGLLARTLLNQSSGLYWARQYQPARAAAEQAATLFRAVNDRRGLAAAVRTIGITVQEIETPDAAMPLFHEALSLARKVGDLQMEAVAMGSIAWASNYLGKPQDTIDAYSKGVELARRAGARLIEAWQLGSLGQAYARLGQFSKALPYYERAIPLEREVEVQMDLGVTLGAIGQAYIALGETAKGLEYGKQSLQVFQELGDRQEEAVALLILGSAYENLARTDEALDHYTRALQIVRNLGNRRREAWVLNQLGGFYANRGDYRLALDFGQQALDMSRAVVDGSMEVRSTVRVADVHRLLGQPQLAVDYYERALATAKRNGLKPDEATTLVRLGYAFSDQGDLTRAHQRYEEALSLVRSEGTALRVVEAATLEGLGGTRLATGDITGAIAAYTESLGIAQSVSDIARQVDALNGLGQAHLSSGDIRAALSIFVDALRLARDGQLSAAEALALRNLMMAWRVAGRAAVATFYGKEAVNLFQTIRANILQLAPETQRAYIRSKEQIYRELADLLITQGRLPEAQQVLDFLKELEFRDYVRRGPTAGEARQVELTPEETEWQRRYLEIDGSIVSLGRERRTLISRQPRTPEDEARLTRLDTDLRLAGQKFRSFMDTLATELGASGDSRERVFQIREAQALMSDLRELTAGTVALYTIVAEQRYVVILITPEIQKAAEFSISAAELSRKVHAFRDALQNPRSDPRSLAQELYTILVGPIARDLDQAAAQTLMWSLDGVLRYLPISALHDGKGYLVQRYRTVLFTPASRSHFKDRPAVWRTGLGVGVSKPVQGFAPLPAVTEELRGIFREVGEHGSQSGVIPGRVLLDEEFTESALRAQLRQPPPVVHIASHFQFRPGNEEDSFLLLGDGQRLSVADLSAEFTLFSGVELLTLSACDTAVGGSSATGKEVESFGMLAQRQGAKAVIATLWPVGDQSTRVLMERFYRSRYGAAAISKAEALRRAQLALLQGTRTAINGRSPGGLTRRRASLDASATIATPYSHPYFWAPFLLIGNGR